MLVPLFLLALVVIPGQAIVNSDSAYLLSLMPQMEVGRQQKACMSLYKYNRLNVHYTIEGDDKKRYFYARQKYRRGQGGCITFTIPRGQEGRANTLKASIIGPKGLRLYTSKTFYPTAPSVKTYIQTDKPFYKPGQMVRIRVMTVDTMLMATKDPISYVRIKSPNDVILKQWRNIKNENGLVSVEYQIGRDPLLGSWVIVVSYGTADIEQTFVVKEYVLPKFSITIKPPESLNERTETIDGEVCATYTYGQPVKGKIMVESCVRLLSASYQGKKPCAVIHGEIAGCFNYSFNAEVLRPQFAQRMGYLKLVTYVSLLEEATGLIVNETLDGPTINKFALRIDVKSHSRWFFKSLLPFELKALVVDENGQPAPDQVVTLWCEEIAFNRTMVTDAKGYITHFFPRLPTEQPIARFKLTAQDNDINTPVVLPVVQWFSPSDQYIEIQPISKTVSIGILPITVYMTKPPPKPFRAVVQVMSRGTIVYQSQNRYKVRKNPDGSYRTGAAWCRNHRGCITDRKFSPDVPSFSVYLDIQCSMSPEVQLLIYYIAPNGEVVADTEYIKIEPCFSNKVGMSFSPEKEYPGYLTKLTLTAAPGSVCGVGVIDKSLYLLGKKKQLSPQDLFSQLNQYNARPEWQQESESDEERYCKDWLNKTGLSNSNEVVPPETPYYYISHTYRYISEYADSETAFKMANLDVLGPLNLKSRPCKKVHTYRYYRGKRSLGEMLDIWQNDGSGAEYVESDDEDEAPDPTKKTAAVRQYFPETWLWDIEVVGASGKLELNKTLPGSITEWVGSAVCRESSAGVGVSEAASVTGFQPFFLSFTLPYAAIRGEHIPIPVSIFNYLSECMEIELRLNESSEFDLLNPERVTWLCVCGNEARRHDFIIVPKELGFINITAQARSVAGDSQCPDVTTNKDYLGVRDAVIQKLLVEPEGDEKEYSYSTVVCKDFYDLVDLPLFPDQVPDSARAVISVIGDFMGPSLSNIGSLLRVPYGCGEQNMINFAPNVYIMTYLKTINRLTPEIQDTIDKYLGSGYERELNYLRNDGSFSAFGNGDSSGSTWLTAFVIKSFTEAQLFLDIDQNVINKARLWLKSKQDSQGCFKEVGRVIHSSMRGGVDNANSVVTLTAYVLGALITAGTPKDDVAVKNAINCIVASPLKDTYTKAVAAYVTALYDVNSRIHVSLQRDLDTAANRNDSLLFWMTKEEKKDSYYYRQRANALNVETTAYGLMAYLEEEDLDSGLKIAKWLETQRNPQGGFSSTQDTVVALEAISRFSARFSEKLKMSLTVSGEGINKNFITTSDNRLVMQTQPLTVPNEISISGAGTGCALFKATVRYTTYSLKKNDLAFTLDTSVTHVNPEKPVCSTRSIYICTTYVRGNSSGMAIVNAKMVTGWVVDVESLQKLKDIPELSLKRYEIDEKRPDNVHFYFDELTRSKRCFTFDIVQELKVENAKEALIQVYDYYETELITKTFYSINDSCGAEGSKPSPSKAPKMTPAPDKTVPDHGGGGDGLDIDKGDGGNVDEEGSGVLDSVDKAYLAVGLRPLPNSIPVVNLNAVVSDMDFSKLPEGEDMKTVDGTQEVVVRVGSTATLNCPLRAKYKDTPDRQYKSAWINEDGHVIAVLGNKLVEDKRMSVGLGTIRIENVTSSDSGSYQCQVNTLPVQTATVILKVQESPKIVSSSEDMTVSAGSDVVLMCNVTGIPTPKVTWFQFLDRSVRKKMGKGQALVLHAVSKTSQYRCVVNNGFPPEVFKQIRVTVNKSSVAVDSRTSALLSSENSTVTVTEGGLAILPCAVRSLGTKTMIWRRSEDTNPLTVGQYVFVQDMRVAVATSVRSGNQDISDHNLLIKHARQSDSGVYGCQISRKTKSQVQSLTITLVVTADKQHEDVPPFVLPKTVSKVAGVLGTTVILQLHIMASPPVLPRWTRRGRPLLGDRFTFNTLTADKNTYIAELRIDNVQGEDFDDYTCEVVNGFGVVSGVIMLYDTTPSTTTSTTVTTKPPFIPVGCPECRVLSEKQAAYAYCQSQAAYKVLGIRNVKGRVRVKVLSDFRPATRVKVRRPLRLIVEKHCKCDVINVLKSRHVVALFMSRKLDFSSSKRRELILGSETVAIALPKATERRILLSKRKSKC